MRPYGVVMLCALFMAPFQRCNAQQGRPIEQKLEALGTAQLDGYAVELLKGGKFYDRAIAALRIAVSRDAANSALHAHLGCALVARFASTVAAARYAADYPRESEQFKARVAAWQAAQADPAHPLFSRPAPQPPPPPIMPDSGTPFTLDPNASRASIVRLAREAAQELALASRQPGEAVPGDVDSQRGWALFLLWRFGRDYLAAPPADNKVSKSDEPSEPKQQDDRDPPRCPTPEQIARCFRQAIEADSENADYWHALGLALVPDYADPARNSIFADLDSGRQPYSKEAVREAESALNRSLSIHFDVNVLYNLAALAAPTDASTAVRHLERATGRFRINAALWYLLAEQLFRQSEPLDGKD